MKPDSRGTRCARRAADTMLRRPRRARAEGDVPMATFEPEPLAWLRQLACARDGSRRAATSNQQPAQTPEGQVRHAPRPVAGRGATGALRGAASGEQHGAATVGSPCGTRRAACLGSRQTGSPWGRQGPHCWRPRAQRLLRWPCSTGQRACDLRGGAVAAVGAHIWGWRDNPPSQICDGPARAGQLPHGPVANFCAH